MKQTITSQFTKGRIFVKSVSRNFITRLYIVIKCNIVSPLVATVDKIASRISIFLKYLKVGLSVLLDI